MKKTKQRLISVGYIVLACSLSIFSSIANAESAGIGTYSEGYRMGIISKFSIKGLMFKSGEGQFLMGREGTPYRVKYGDLYKTINPWYFSATKEKSNLVNPIVGEYVWASYHQSRIKSPSYDTDYMIKNAQLVTRSTPTGCVDKSASGSKSKGIRVGRIVKASRKGTVSKSYEALIQVGNSGNQFKHMSINSDFMYNCVVNVLKSGKKVKVHYTESFFVNPFGQSTNYDILKIETISDI